MIDQNQNPIPSQEENKAPNQEASAPEGVNIPAEATPEAVPQPISPEAPQTETFSDTQGNAAPAQPAPAQPQAAQDDDQDESSAEVQADLNTDEVPTNEVDKKFMKAVDDAIDKYEDKPYEEEEVSEDLETKYLKKRFGKDVKKSG